MRNTLLYALIVPVAGSIALSGCTVSPVYVMEKERDDQEMVRGNRGYLQGDPPPAEERAGLKRSFLAVDVELYDKEEAEKARETSVRHNQEITKDSHPAAEPQKRTAPVAPKKRPVQPKREQETIK
ncbi:MAG: hypothetical protein ABIJ27_00470 [Candidatus Omnitrophota bacterium]